MIINNLENSNFVVSVGTSIKEAMSIITTNHRGCLMVVDENNHLVGVLSDGDIRRALVKGVNMLSSIDNAVNHNPVFLKQGSASFDEETNKIFVQNININLVPVVDNDNSLVAVLVRD